MFLEEGSDGSVYHFVGIVEVISDKTAKTLKSTTFL